MNQRPLWEIEAPEAAPGFSDLPPGYRSARYVGRVLRGFVRAVGVIIVFIFLALLGVELDIGTGVVVEIALGIFVFGSIAGAILLGLFWTWLVARNARKFGGKSRWLKLWPVAAWFVPFGMAILPYFVLRDVWDATTPDSRGHVQVWAGFWAYPALNTFAIPLTFALIGIAAAYLLLVSLFVAGALFVRMSKSLEEFQDVWKPRQPVDEAATALPSL